MPVIDESVSGEALFRGCKSSRFNKLENVALGIDDNSACILFAEGIMPPNKDASEGAALGNSDDNSAAGLVIAGLAAARLTSARAISASDESLSERGLKLSNKFLIAEEVVFDNNEDTAAVKLFATGRTSATDAGKSKVWQIL